MKDQDGRDKHSVEAVRDRDDAFAFKAAGWTEAGGAEQFGSPLSDLIGKEESASKDFSALKRDEIRQIRIETISILCRAAIGDPNREPDPISTGVNVLVWAWDLQLPPCDQMTQEQIGALVIQGRAAICERHKKALRKKGKSGGRKSQREKSSSLRDRLAKKARGNSNRATATAAATLREGYASE